jgi:hypothetical protein
VIADPTTTLTDYLLAVLLGVLAARLTGETAGRVPPSRALWAVAFALGAVAAAAGGTEHALRPRLDVFSRALLRQCAYLGASLVGSLLVAGLAFEVANGRARRYVAPWAAVLALLELLAVSRSFRTRDVVVVGALNLVLLLALAARHQRTESRLLKWLAAAVALAGAGLVVQAAGLAPHPSFNHNDLCHVLMCAALWPFYRAARLLGAEPARPTLRDA